MQKSFKCFRKMSLMKFCQKVEALHNLKNITRYLNNSKRVRKTMYFSFSNDIFKQLKIVIISILIKYLTLHKRFKIF